MFERFDSRYDLRGRLISKTALHIGAGGSLAIVGSDNPVVRDVNGLPYIPGSSFKGSLRSLVEAIVRTLSPGERQEPWACDPLNNPCLDATVLAGRSDDQISQIIEHGANNAGGVCTVCRLFGSPWLASKVKVTDLYLTEGPNWRAWVEVRDGVAIDRDTETVSGGRKYDFETVPRKTAFNLHIRVDNASNEELGLLFLGLREFANGSAWVGRNTSRGLGLVKIEWDTFEIVEGRAGLLAYLQSGKGSERKGDDITTFIAQKTRAFLQTLTKGGSDNVEETAQPGND
jgi:CRISPR-associated RAMP protein (TIGR02581 family)